MTEKRSGRQPLDTLQTTCEPPPAMRETVRAWKKAMKFTPELDERAELLSVLANATRLRAFYVLDRLEECCVCDLAEILDVTPSAASQHLSKFKAYGLVTSRRENQTIFYRLTDAPQVRLARELALRGLERA